MSTKPFIQNVYPLTPMQQGMLFHSLFDNNKNTFFVQLSFKAEGALKPQLLQQSLNLLVQRHDVFRTVFHADKSKQPLQIVLEARNNDLIYQDVTAYDEQEQQEMVNEYLETDRDIGFDLSKDSLLRVAAFKRQEQSFDFVFSFHHIIIDGWCIGTVVKEFFELYQSIESGRTSKLEALPPFGQYVRWLGSRNEEMSGAYWRTYLEGLELQTLIPWANADKQEGYVQDKVRFCLSKSDTEQLAQMARRQQVTLSTVIHALWAIALQRYNYSDDIVFGTVVSGRNADLPGVAKMVGLLINTNPVRVTFQRGMKFDRLLQHLHQRMLEAEEHSCYPLTSIQADSHLDRNVVNHVIGFENVPLDIDLLGEEQVSGIRLSDFELSDQTNYDFNLVIIPSEELSFTIKYNALRYARSDMQRVAGHIRQLVRCVLRNPSANVDDLELVNAEERNLLLHAFNKPVAKRPSFQAVHELFEAQVKQRPAQTAAVCRDEHITYEQLNKRAEWIAYRLKQCGAGREQVVAISLSPSIDMLAAVLGVMKAGAAFLPIDTHYPVQRMEYVLKDSGAAVLISHKDTLERMDYRDNGIAIQETVWNSAAIEHFTANSPRTEAYPDQLAYVIYTSGSTGQPKGVMIEHQGLHNLCQWHIRSFGVTAVDRAAKYAGFGFDASVWEIFPYLSCGASIYIVNEEDKYDVEKVNRLMERNGITIGFLPTPFFEQFVKLPNTSLRVLLTGGDKLKQTAEQSYQVYNNYGPSENTVVTTSYKVVHNSPAIPIGQPIDNTQVYIVKHHQLQPVGVAGELCIGGVGLFRGYLNNEELTREKLIGNPYAPGEKMYRTGDLARWLPDGNLEFLGRIDQQVSIRGFRIELEEIEAKLLMNPAVQDAVVADKEDKAGAKYLCAYVVASETLEAEKIKAQLLEELPEYMVPAYVIQLERIPVTPNGKVDRRALPEPDRTTRHAAGCEGPRNEAEASMVLVWKQVLGISDIGMNDNFFQLGGDSIKAIQLSSHLKKSDIHVEIKDIFNKPTIRQLSVSLYNRSAKSAYQGVVEGEAPLGPIQHWFFENQFTDNHHWNQSVMLFNKGGFHIPALKKVLNRLLEHHDALRMVYSSRNGQIRQQNRGWKPDLFGFDVFDFSSKLQAEAQITEAAKTVQAGMNLAEGPLVRAGLFRTAQGDHLLIAIHHLVVDGVSWRILLEDLAEGYRQAMAGAPLHFPPKTSSYKEWTEFLLEYAQSEEHIREADYWNAFAHQSWTPLPKDATAECNRVKDEQVIDLKLSAAETKQLLRQAGRRYETEVNDLLLTALGLALKQWRKAGRILIGLEGHGREELSNELDMNRTVGWFTALYPVLLEIPEAADLETQIRSVKQTLRNIPRKGIGYGIHRYLTSADDKGNNLRQLKPELTFNYLGHFDLPYEEFVLSHVSGGPMFSGENERAHALDITGIVIDGELRFSFLYNGLEFKAETIAELSACFKTSLLHLIEHCVRGRTGDEPVVEARVEEKNAGIYSSGTSDPERLHHPFPLTDIQMAYLLGRNKGFDIGGVSTHAYTEVETSIDIQRFNDSLNQVIRRHPMMRAIVLAGGEQRILEQVPEYKIEVIDVRNLDKQSKAQCIDNGRQRMSHDVFQTDRWPLFEFIAYRMGEDDYLLCISRDLLIADAASMDIMGQDLMKYYENPDVQLPELSFTFRDYVLAYKPLKNSEVYHSDRQYWQNQLDTFPSAPQLPVKQLAADITVQPTFHRVEKTYSIDKWQQLKNIAYDQVVTPATMLAAIYAQILSLWSNQSELVLNVTVYNRYPFHPDVDKIIGDFTSNLLLGITLDPKYSFWEQARSIQSRLLDALEHRHYEGVEFIRDIAKHKGLDYGKAVMPIVFTAVLNEESNRQGAGFEALGNLKTGISQTSQVYIDFQATILSDELWLFWDYVEQLFDADVINQMFSSFTSVVEGLLVTGQPAAVELSEPDRALLEAYNQTDEDIARTTLHGLFVEQVKRVPEEPAVIAPDKSMSYRELHVRSNQLAHYLQEQGIGRHDLIG
ncbi:amino acid adenylation domain-containing protein, partial [Paenibacillus alvei]|uniref:amino acid adenylation domain-containing protein n=1 Tax=Paenibacillus alvei TaxID=44250 RepID=UPI003D278705